MALGEELEIDYNGCGLGAGVDFNGFDFYVLN